MRKIPLLIESEIKFPETDQALEEPNGLLAAGGSLSKETLLSAYKNGIFPWFENNSPIHVNGEGFTASSASDYPPMPKGVCTGKPMHFISARC